MSASLDSVPKNPPPRASLRGLAIPELFVFLTFSGVALATFTSSMDGAGFAAPSPAGILGLSGIIALPTLVAVVALRLRRAHLSRPQTRKALASIEALQVSPPPAIVAHAAQLEAEVQALRLKVRTLTAELAEQRSRAQAQTRVRVRVQEQAKAQALAQVRVQAQAKAQALAQARVQAQAKAQAQDSRDVGRERGEMRAAESRRVLLMVHAMREATAGEPGAEHVLNRIEAALTRLNAPSGGRPTLPALIARDTVTDWPVLPGGPTPPVMTAPAPVPFVSAPLVSVPLAPEADVPVPPAPVPPVPPVPEPPIIGSRILPVPPQAPEQPAVRKGGRWFGRKSGRHAERSAGQQVPR